MAGINLHFHNHVSASCNLLGCALEIVPLLAIRAANELLNAEDRAYGIAVFAQRHKKCPIVRIPMCVIHSLKASFAVKQNSLVANAAIGCQHVPGSLAHQFLWRFPFHGSDLVLFLYQRPCKLVSEFTIIVGVYQKCYWQKLRVRHRIEILAYWESPIVGGGCPVIYGPRKRFAGNFGPDGVECAVFLSQGSQAIGNLNTEDTVYRNHPGYTGIFGVGVSRSYYSAEDPSGGQGLFR